MNEAFPKEFLMGLDRQQRYTVYKRWIIDNVIYCISYCFYEWSSRRPFLKLFIRGYQLRANY